MGWEKEYKLLEKKIEDKGLEIKSIRKKLAAQQIETPSWGYADSGTRFGVFRQPGIPRNIHEKLDDAAHVNAMTGCCKSVALHIPWDMTDDWDALKDYADDKGVVLGAINPNVFQESCYKMGSFGNEDAKIRQKALDRHYQCIDVMRATGSKVLSCWYADGTNYPGQGSIKRRKKYFEECFAKVYARMKKDEMMFIEYKLFEPGFYHTDIADWGMAYSFCMATGERAKVLVDLGHHAQGTNIEHIVTFLMDQGRLGGFHFNDRKYADDDLTSGAIDPYQLFRIYSELAEWEIDLGKKFDVAYLIDQSHNVKPKLEAMIQTLMMLQTQYAKALLVDRKTLKKAQIAGDIVTAERCLVEAFQTDVEPLLASIRVEKGLKPDPLKAHRESGYLKKAIAERGSPKETGADSWA